MASAGLSGSAPAHRARSSRRSPGRRPQSPARAPSARRRPARRSRGSRLRDREGDVPERSVRPGEAPHLQHHVGLRLRARRKHPLEASAHHAFDHRAHRHVRRCRRSRHPLAVAQHDDAIGNPTDLLQPMRDKDDPDAFSPELAHLLKEEPRFRSPPSAAVGSSRMRSFAFRRVPSRSRPVLLRGQGTHLPVAGRPG